MRLQPSLLLRLTVLLFAAQIVGAFVIGLHQYSGYLRDYMKDPETAIIMYGLESAQRTVAEAVLRGDSGAHIASTPQLQQYEKQRPMFRYAAFDLTSGEPISGGSPEIAQSLKIQGPAVPNYLSFDLTLKDGTKWNGFASVMNTAVGPLLIAVSGWRADWAEVGVDFIRFEAINLEYFAPTLLVSIVASWIALRFGLTPLREAAAQARKVEMGSLDQRLSTEKIPSEILPLVETINQALSRLDEGVSRYSQFLANAAHELRTPVMVLSARANGPEKPTFRRDVQRDVRRMRNIIEQLLSFARLGRAPHARDELVDLVEIATAMVDDYALLAVKSGKRIDYDGAEEPVVVVSDRQALESIISNLIENALRAEPPEGAVIVRVTSDATVAVEDHGEGVAPADREVIFEPFWRKSDTSAGMGLGLAIARDLMRKLSGRIWVEATPGGGATFKLWLPYLEES